MPSDASYGLSKMYFGEDNAGIISTLLMSLRSGFEGHVALFGEFINAAYLSASGLISLSADTDNLALLAVLTHYNMTLLFMAWLPLTALAAIALSGKKFNFLTSVVVLTVSSATLGLLLWPFVTIGHTAVVSAGLFALPLLAVTLNRKLAVEDPILFALVISSLGFIVGTTWFPLMPFAAATVALSFISLLQSEYQKGNKRLVISLGILFGLLALLLLPGVLELALTSGDFLGIDGGTRKPGRVLVVLWFIAVGLIIFMLLRGQASKVLIGPNLFLAVIATLAVSNLYLLISGLLAN
jgi:hypothetical protein